MKTSKLLALLALAGFCGTSETQAKSNNRNEIKHLEKRRAQVQATHREAKERLRELDYGSNLGAGAQMCEAIDDGNWAIAEKEIRNLNWDVKNPGLIREREAEEARMREAAKEISRINKAIRKARA